MKTILALLMLAAASVSSFAVTGQIGPYTYAYDGSPVDAPVTAIDPPPGSIVIDISTGTHYRKVSASGTNTQYAVDQIMLTSATTPVTSGTITANASKADEFIISSGTATALTLAIPSNTNSRISQEITLLSGSNIATFALTGTAGQTVLGGIPSALTANVPIRYTKTAASTWTRIAQIITDSGIVITAPVITTGLTASGSASNDFSASTGTFKTSTGANTLSGDVSVAAGKDVVFAAGDGVLDASLGTGATKTTSGLFTVTGGDAHATATLSGAGAISVVKGVTKVTSTGVDDALTLANGTDGQIVRIIHDVDGGSAVLTPTTKTGFTTITFTAVGESATLIYVTTRGWIILSLNGAVAA